MPKQYVENKTANPIFVGGKMILPGHGREVEAPAPAKPIADEAPAQPPLAERLAQLLGQTIAPVQVAGEGRDPEAMAAAARYAAQARAGGEPAA